MNREKKKSLYFGISAVILAIIAITMSAIVIFGRFEVDVFDGITVLSWNKLSIFGLVATVIFTIFSIIILWLLYHAVNAIAYVINHIKTKMQHEHNNYCLGLAEEICEESSCLRRKYGAVIVHKKLVITVHDGTQTGASKCQLEGQCQNTCFEAARRTPYYGIFELVQQKMSDIINKKIYGKINNATLYITGKEVEDETYIKMIRLSPVCKRTIINAGIKRVVIREDKQNYKEYIL